MAEIPKVLMTLNVRLRKEKNVQELKLVTYTESIIWFLLTDLEGHTDRILPEVVLLRTEGNILFLQSRAES